MAALQRTDLPTVLPKVIRAGLYVVPFLPLYVANQLMFPYVTGRNFAFRILLETLLIPYAALCAISRAHRPRWSPITAAFAVFVAVVAVADSLGVNPARSFWSTYERMGGLLALLHLGLFFLLMKAAFQTSDQWRRYFSTSFGVSGTIAVIALVEFGRGVSGRIDGTLGNPGYLAGYLLLHVFVGLLLVSQARHEKARLLLVAVLALDLAALYLTGTRAALLAVVAALPAVAVLWHRGRAVSWAFSGAGLGVSTGLVALIVISFYVPPLQGLVSRGVGGFQSRVRAWGVTWDIARTRLWTGFGQENLQPVWEQQAKSLRGTFDRAHNIVMDVLVDAGFLGLAAFVVLLVVVAIDIRALREREHQASAAATGFVVAYLVFLLFWFEMLPTAFVFISLLAYVDHRVHGTPAADVPKPFRAWRGIVTAAPVALAVAAAIHLLNVRPMLAASYVVSAMKAWGDGDSLSLVNAHVTRALDYSGAYRTEVIWQVAVGLPRVIATRRGSEPAELQRFVQRAVAEVETLANGAPPEPQNMRLLAEVYAATATLVPSYRQRAIDVFDRALVLFPYDYQTSSAYVSFHLAQRDYQSALAVQQRAVALQPDDEGARFELLRIAIRAGVPAEAELALFRQYLTRTPSLAAMAASYIRTRDIELARMVLAEMRRREPAAPELRQYEEILTRLEQQKSSP